MSASNQFEKRALLIIVSFGSRLPGVLCAPQNIRDRQGIDSVKYSRLLRSNLGTPLTIRREIQERAELPFSNSNFTSHGQAQTTERKRCRLGIRVALCPPQVSFERTLASELASPRRRLSLGRLVFVQGVARSLQIVQGEIHCLLCMRSHQQALWERWGNSDPTQG